MIITTLNSVYEVKAVNNSFEITKLEDTSNGRSTYNKVGQTRVSPTMAVRVGDRARFDHWATSEVLSIED